MSPSDQGLNHFEPLKGVKILVLVSGSVSAYKSLSLVSRLVQGGAEVEVALSTSASQFVTATSFEALTQKRPFTSLWEPSRAMSHIQLNEWADLCLLYPASANQLQRLSLGLADDLIGCIALARNFDKPFWLAPAMNPRMWHHPATQEAVRNLSKWNFKVLQPEVGRMACGARGEGRLIEPEFIYTKISNEFGFGGQSDSGHRWLITAGGTREPLDSVRFIGNHSTGRTGAQLTNELLNAGDRVTLLTSHTAEVPSQHQNLIQDYYTTFAELAEKLEKYLGQTHYDGFISAAAVSDYSPVNALSEGKKSSDEETWNIELKRNPKLINQVRSWSLNSELYLVGFKLMTNASEEESLKALHKQQEEARPDLIVFNQIEDVNSKGHTGRVWKRGMWLNQFQDRRELAQVIRQDYLNQIKSQEQGDLE